MCHITNLARCKLGWGCLLSKDYRWILHLLQHEIRGAAFSPMWIPHEVDFSHVCASIYTSASSNTIAKVCLARASSSTNATVCLASASSSTIGGWNEEEGGDGRPCSVAANDVAMAKSTLSVTQHKPRETAARHGR